MGSKAKVDTTFSQRTKDLQAYADTAFQAANNQGQPLWLPTVMGMEDVDFDDPESIPKEMFGRDGIEQQFEDVTKSPEDPGTVGDLGVIQLQGDFLASLERAFRSRYMDSYTRALAHAAARQEAAGDQEGGTIRRNGMDYIEDLLKRAST